MAAYPLVRLPASPAPSSSRPTGGHPERFIIHEESRCLKNVAIKPYEKWRRPLPWPALQGAGWPAGLAFHSERKSVRAGRRWLSLTSERLGTCDILSIYLIQICQKGRRPDTCLARAPAGPRVLLFTVSARACGRGAAGSAWRASGLAHATFYASIYYKHMKNCILAARLARAPAPAGFTVNARAGAVGNPAQAFCCTQSPSLWHAFRAV